MWFNDVPEGIYYERPVRWAVENRITKGTGGGAFSPDLICTRAELITLCYRMETNMAVMVCKHSYTVTAETAPTCTERGTAAYVCSKCGNRYTAETEPLGHNYQLMSHTYLDIVDNQLVWETITTIPASETAGPYETYRCARCGSKTHRNLEPVPEGLYDINEAMEAGNDLAREYGCYIGYCLDETKICGYFPGSDYPVFYLENHGGQSALNAEAVAEVQYTIDQLIDADGEEAVRNAQIRCYIVYLEDNPYYSEGGHAYDIVVYYG